MTTSGFSGGAGTGKTTRLLTELDTHLGAHPLKPGQRVLALTFMHGSRRRLADRLAKSKARRQCECMTLDRFAWEICRRWRSRLRATGGFLSLDLGSAGATEYDAVCEAAGRLLAAPDVLLWVAKRFPVIILDEFQDCTAVRVSIARALHGKLKLLIAADDFQNLSLSVESPAVMWLRGLGSCQDLTFNHRTSVADLLNAAKALREGQTLVDGGGSGFKIMSVPSAAVAASYISKTLWPSTGKAAVVLTPTKPERSNWVRDIVQLVGTKKYGPKKEIGPVAITWESTSENIEESVVAALGIGGGDGPIDASVINKLGRGPLVSRLQRWADHQRRVLGVTQFTAAELRTQIKRALHQVRAFGSTPPASRRAMTIHQAKNREFPVVIILWPFEIKNDPIRLRRLLYNAVTRAQRRAIIIVNDPKKERVTLAPFAGLVAAPASVATSVKPTQPSAIASFSASAEPPQVAAPIKALYLAYGSNMWEEQMTKRCKEHEKVGKAILVGYRWIISTRGVANVVVSPEHTVEGTLFRISASDEVSLDHFERVAEGAYGKEKLQVEHAGEKCMALVYVDPITEEGSPNPEYVVRINKGVKDAQLSAEYLASQIRQFIPASECGPQVGATEMMPGSA